jgi:single-strand DNA-binding protein
MSGYNRAIVAGHLGRDPEVRRLPDGNPVVNVSIATSESWKDKETGEKREITEWHRIVIFNENAARVVEQYCTKGSYLTVEGKLRTRKWQDQQGVEKYSTEIVVDRFDGKVVLGPNTSGGGSSGRDDQYAGEQASRYGKPGNKQSGSSVNDSGPPQKGSKYGDLDDDIPF